MAPRPMLTARGAATAALLAAFLTSPSLARNIAPRQLTITGTFSPTSSDFVPTSTTVTLLPPITEIPTLSVPPNGTSIFPTSTAVPDEDEDEDEDDEDEEEEEEKKPVRTIPCNGYTEFCDRKYGNITFVAAHNSPFVQPGSVAANQDLDVTIQLNDGIRMLQGQAHMQDGELHYCHSSCALLDSGTVTSYLRKVVKWIEENDNEVVTILIGNGGFVSGDEFVKPVRDSGLERHLYDSGNRTAKTVDDWPTLQELIDMDKRVILFVDYLKPTENTPTYLHDEFTYMWETPFSQTDRAFPCTVHRPENLPEERAREMLYIANHNLNAEFSFAGNTILVPNTVELNLTNALEGPQSLGKQARECRANFGRPPNFLLVDYYEHSDPPGEVFRVAAEMNGVTFIEGSCCGLTERKKNSAGRKGVGLGMMAVVGMIGAFILL